MSTRDALAALQRGDDTAARTALISAWRARRSPVLAELVELISLRSPDAIDHAIAAILTPRVITSCANLATLEQLDDPRLARFAIDALENLPFSGVTAKPLLAELIATAERLRDPRLVDRAAAIAETIGARVTRAAIRGTLLRHLERAVAKVPQPNPPSAAEAAIEHDLAAALEPVRKPHRSATALLADIYAHPLDDAPRLVYADQLTELGDPRGEFITLQLTRGTGEPLPRELELLKQHGKAWLGALAPALSFGKRYSGTRFARGFVATADIILSVGKKLQPILADPAWATVEEITGYWDSELLVRAPLRALRRFEQALTSELLAKIATRAEPLDVEEVAIDIGVDRELLRRAFPKLRAVRTLCRQPGLVEVAALEQLGVDRVELSGHFIGHHQGGLEEAKAGFDTLITLLVGRPAGTAELALRSPWGTYPAPAPIVLRRGADGRYEL